MDRSIVRRLSNSNNPEGGIVDALEFKDRAGSGVTP